MVQTAEAGRLANVCGLPQGVGTAVPGRGAAQLGRLPCPCDQPRSPGTPQVLGLPASKECHLP